MECKANLCSIELSVRRVSHCYTFGTRYSLDQFYLQVSGTTSTRQTAQHKSWADVGSNIKRSIRCQGLKIIATIHFYLVMSGKYQGDLWNSCVCTTELSPDKLIPWSWWYAQTNGKYPKLCETSCPNEPRKLSVSERWHLEGICQYLPKWTTWESICLSRGNVPMIMMDL